MEFCFCSEDPRFFPNSERIEGMKSSSCLIFSPVGDLGQIVNSSGILRKNIGWWTEVLSKGEAISSENVLAGLIHSSFILPKTVLFVNNNWMISITSEIFVRKWIRLLTSAIPIESLHATIDSSKARVPLFEFIRE
jgi:hypothetical protein